MRKIISVLFLILLLLICILAVQIMIPDKRPVPDEYDVNSDVLFSSEFEESTSDISGFLDTSNEVSLPFQSVAESVILYDLDGDKLVYAKNPDKSVSPASLTKIMTALVALQEEKDLNRVLTFRKEMADELLGYGYSLADLATYDLIDGEQLTLEEALNIMMVRSSNDVANLIAEEIAGSREQFVALMNKLAEEIHANNTHFTNAHGLDDPQLKTTSYDMFLISKYAVEQFPMVFDVTGQTEYTLTTNKRTNHKVQSYLYIRDPLNEDFSFYYPYVVGGKTGFTEDAGRCLISIAKKDGKRMLMILMGVSIFDEAGEKRPHTYYLDEVKAFYQWAFGDEDEISL